MMNRFSKTISEISPFKIIVVGLLYIQFLAVAPKAIQTTRVAQKINLKHPRKRKKRG